jgi:hypothetical protein
MQGGNTFPFSFHSCKYFLLCEIFLGCGGCCCCGGCESCGGCGGCCGGCCDSTFDEELLLLLQLSGFREIVSYFGFIILIFITSSSKVRYDGSMVSKTDRDIENSIFIKKYLYTFL